MNGANDRRGRGFLLATVSILDLSEVSVTRFDELSPAAVDDSTEGLGRSFVG